MAVDSPAAQLAAVLSGHRAWTALGAEEALAVIESARYHSLGPVLLWQLRQQGVDTSGPEWAALSQQARGVAVRYALAVLVQRQVDEALLAVGIPTIWIKGYALCHAYYPDPAGRAMGDLDVLVPGARRLEALTVVEGLGYRLHEAELFPGHQSVFHHHHLVGGPGGAIHLELHFTLGDPAVLRVTEEQLAWFWEQRQAFDRDGVSFTSLAPEAHLLYLALHALAHHGEEEFVLRRYLDMHLLVAGSPDLDWQLLVEQARQFGWTAVLGRALTITSELFDTPLPEGLLAGLAATPSVPAAVARVLAPRPSPDDKLQHALGRVSRMPLGLRLRWLLGLVFPSPAYMRWRYGVQEGWKLPLLYPWRWLLVLGEMLKALGGRLKA